MPGVQNVVALRDVFLHEAFHFRWALDDAGTTDLLDGSSVWSHTAPPLGDVSVTKARLLRERGATEGLAFPGKATVGTPREGSNWIMSPPL